MLQESQLRDCSYAAGVRIDESKSPSMSITKDFWRDGPMWHCCRTLILDRCPGTFQPRMANYWMYLNSSDNLQHLSMADNHYVSDEDLHVLCELDKLLSLNFSGCAQVEDEGLAVRCPNCAVHCRFNNLAFDLHAGKCMLNVLPSI